MATRPPLLTESTDPWLLGLTPSLCVTDNAPFFWASLTRQLGVRRLRLGLAPNLRYFSTTSNNDHRAS